MTPGATGQAQDYTDDEQAALAVNLYRLSEQIHKGELIGRPSTLDLLRWMHEQLFTGVRDHAGRIRQSGFGSPVLTFGPHRSPENSEVPDLLLDVFHEFQKALASFDADPNAPNYEHAGMQLATWVHARVIGIHPFEDGNGRTSRALLNWTLVRLGLRPIAFDAVRQDYLTCLNPYFVVHDIQPLVDLCIRLIPDGG